MTFDEQMQQAFDAGCYMRVFNKPRSDVPMYEMGEDGRQLRLRWLAGWDRSDVRIRESRKAEAAEILNAVRNSGGVK